MSSYSNNTSNVKNAARNAADTVSETATDAKNTVVESINKAGRKVHDSLHTAGEKFCDATDQVSDHVKENPVKSAVVALGIGYLLGKLFSR